MLGENCGEFAETGRYVFASSTIGGGRPAFRSAAVGNGTAAHVTKVFATGTMRGFADSADVAGFSAGIGHRELLSCVMKGVKTKKACHPEKMTSSLQDGSIRNLRGNQFTGTTSTSRVISLKNSLMPSGVSAPKSSESRNVPLAETVLSSPTVKETATGKPFSNVYR